MNVELIYDLDCPNIEETRKSLLVAFKKFGYPPSWKEWDRNSVDSPSHARKFGSPTILVNGSDITGYTSESDSNCCRIYGSSGIPSADLILNAFQKAKKNKSSRTAWFYSTAIGPGLGAAILAKASCPLCYPAIGGLLSSIGLGFLFEGHNFIILMSLFFSIALFGLAFRAKSRRGYGPFLLGVISATVGVWARFENVESFFYLGILGLFCASIWNLIPKKERNECNNPLTEEICKMNTKRKVEIFSAGCSVCDEVVDLVNRLACPNCEVSILDMNDASVAARAKNLGVKSVPSVAVNGVLANCCSNQGIDEQKLKDAGIGVS